MIIIPFHKPFTTAAMLELLHYHKKKEICISKITFFKKIKKKQGKIFGTTKKSDIKI